MPVNKNPAESGNEKLTNHEVVNPETFVSAGGFSEWTPLEEPPTLPTYKSGCSTRLSFALSNNLLRNLCS